MNRTIVARWCTFLRELPPWIMCTTWRRLLRFMESSPYTPHMSLWISAGGHSPIFPSLHLRHSSFSNPSFASPTSQALHLRHLASSPCFCCTFFRVYLLAIVYILYSSHTCGERCEHPQLWWDSNKQIFEPGLIERPVLHYLKHLNSLYRFERNYNVTRRPLKVLKSCFCKRFLFAFISIGCHLNQQIFHL